MLPFLKLKTEGVLFCRETRCSFSAGTAGQDGSRRVRREIGYFPVQLPVVVFFPFLCQKNFSFYGRRTSMSYNK